MVFEYAVSQFLKNKNKKNKKNKKGEKFTSDNNDEPNSSMMGLLEELIYIAFFITAMVFFFKCKNIKDDFSILEFLGALCYPIIYVIYRIFVPVNKENCKSDDQRRMEDAALVLSMMNEQTVPRTVP